MSDLTTKVKICAWKNAIEKAEENVICLFSGEPFIYETTEMFANRRIEAAKENLETLKISREQLKLAEAEKIK